MSLSRRELLLRGAALAGAATLPSATPGLARPGARRHDRRRLLAAGEFDCGVASGMPGQRSALLWTRVGGLERSGRLAYEVSRDREFRHVVAAGTTLASAAQDFTVHQRVTGLAPGSEYYYRFHHRDGSSPVGRLRTRRPADSREPVKLALFSCQNYEAGYYTAHAGLAQEDVDLVVPLGDYIYERRYYGGPRTDATGPNRDGDVQTLPEYRAKYRLYRADPHLQAMHAAFACAPIWDDHEVEDNYAGARPDSVSTDPTRYENDDESPRRVPFAQRRAAGYRAYHEYLPRPPAYDYGTIPLGAHATLFLTDERGHRSAQPCRDATAQACPEAADSRLTLLGAAQKRWFKRALESDRATWKLWANEVMAMPLDTAPGVPLYVDQWDGYQAEREEILRHVVSHGIRNLTALTGDIHTFFAGELRAADGTPAGVEFCGGSISSPGFDERVTAARLPGFEANLLAQNPHIGYADTSRRGYMLVTAAHDALSVEFRSPATTRAPSSPVSTLARFAVPSGSHVVTRT